MKCVIKRSNLRGEITCPSSKSYTHRAIFAASLADGQSTVNDALYSRDTRASIDACRKFGAQIDEDSNTLHIVGRPRPNSASIDAQNSGTTLRIASAIASLSSKTSTLTGDPSLQMRPVGPLLDSLESIGAHCESQNGTPPVSVRGPIAGGKAVILGDVSSQFVTALLMAAPCTPDGLALSIKGNVVSRPYIDATISVMRNFGANILERTIYAEYFVEPRPYRPSSFSVPSDYSILGLLLAASVLTGDDIRIAVNSRQMPQGDSVFMDILESMGVKVKVDNGIMRTISPTTLGGGTFELGDSPDLLPPLAILALKCDEPIKILGIAHARTKETDRIAVLAEQLTHLGIDTKPQDDSLTLTRMKNPKLDSVSLDASNDHRIFMALCIACMYTGGSVDGAESVSVSYPDFIADMQTIGAQIDKDF